MGRRFALALAGALLALPAAAHDGRWRGHGRPYAGPRWYAPPPVFVPPVARPAVPYGYGGPAWVAPPYAPPSFYVPPQYPVGPGLYRCPPGWRVDCDGPRGWGWP